MRYKILFSRQAQKDVEALTPKLRDKLKKILVDAIAVEPYSGKRLLRDLEGSYSYRLTYKDRIVYSIDEAKKVIYVERAKTHYGE